VCCGVLHKSVVIWSFSGGNGVLYGWMNSVLALHENAGIFCESNDEYFHIINFPINYSSIIVQFGTAKTATVSVVQ
jgi:hypothetical protein